MKNILLMILVATIPFMSIAQKRSKKSNAKMGEFVKKSPSEFEYMVSKQRKGFLILGLLALLTFFTSIQTLSVGTFILHLLLDVVFGVYAYASFQVRASLIQMQNISSVNEDILELDEYEYLKQAV